MRKGVSYIVALLALVVIVAGIYLALTYQRTLVDLPISFTVGADRTTSEFDMPTLHNMVQVTVVVTSGSALWRASIVDTSGSTVWTHSASQGDQTTYSSVWVALPSGHYTFSFGTIGLGSLQADVKVTSKGGIW